jgi:hypothetical protein
MPPETKKRFSFTDTAAQQPERQRFSFTGVATQPQKQTKSLGDAMSAVFPGQPNQYKFVPPPTTVTEKATAGDAQAKSEVKESLATLSKRDMSKDTISAAPPKTLLERTAEILRERQPSRLGSFVKDVAQGTIREFAALGAGEGTVTPTQSSGVLTGSEPFSRESIGREYADLLGKGETINPEVARGIGIFAGLLSLPGNILKGTLRESARILSKTNDVKLINNELKRVGLSGSQAERDAFIQAIKDETNAKRIEDALTELAKPKNNVPSKPVVDAVTPGAVDAPPVTPSAIPTPTQVPTPTAPARFSFTNTVKQTSTTPAVAVARTATPDPRNFKTADEFVAAQGTPVYHGTKTPFTGAFSKEKIGSATDTGMVGKGFYFSDKAVDAKQYAGDTGQIKEVFLDLKNPYVIDDYSQIPDVRLREGTQEAMEQSDKMFSDNLTAWYKERGYDGVIDNTSNNKQYVVFEPEQIKTKAELESVWNEAQKTAPVPTPIPKVSKVTTQRLDDVETSKQWTEDPVKAQAESTQEVAKKYSNTDAEKGFVTDAVNHMDNVPPIKNVTAKARNFAKNPGTPIDLPPETLRGWLQTRIQDSAYRLGLVQKEIIKRGGKISDDANALVQREAYIGRAAEKIGRFEKKLGMVAGSKNGLLMRARKDGITLEMIDEYVRAKATGARNARVNSITKGKVSDGGAGLTNKQADEILARYKGNSKMEEYAKEFRGTVINPKMQVLKEAGIYTDEQIKLITQGEPDYVPFKVEEFSRVQGGGKGFSVQSTGVKGIKGSARTDRTNAVIQSVVDYEEAVIRAEKNKALQSLAKLIEENPDSTLWEVKAVTYTPQYDRFGEVQFLRKNPINERTSVEFFKDGKAFEIRFHDEALAQVFTEQGLTKPIPGLVKINNYLRAVNTVINPEFMITNAIRDLQTAIVTAGGEKGAVVAAKMVKDYPAASKGIWQAVRNESNTGWAKVYNEMIENGGRTGWFDLKEVGETTKMVSKQIERYNSTKTSDALMRAVDSVGNLISDANEVFEMSIRTAAYKQLVDGGMSKVAAANYTKNMTVNFNKRGNWGITLNSAYLFANAGIQGSARLLMAMKNPRVRRITYGIAASSYALNELNMKLNPEGYERLQDFEKERNLVLMLPLDGNKYNLPGISGDPANGYYLKMPLPYGFNVFKVGGDVAYDVVNKKKTNAEGMVQMLRAIDASFNPLSSGTPTQFITPTFIDPFVSHWENKNWFGAPIMPEQPAFAPAVRDSDRYFSGARDLSVGTAQFLNRLTGGNEVTSGAVDISPETIDHVIDSIGGGLGNFIGQTVDGTINTVKGDVPTPDEMPFIRKLIDTPFETGEQSQVFELLEKSATNRMSAIEIERFIKNATRAIETGQIDDATAKRVIKDFVSNAARQEAGEVLSLVKEGKFEEAQKVIAEAPPSISKELEKLIEDDVEREIKRLKKELEQ